LAAGSAARPARRGPGWYVADFHAVALLDRTPVVTIERREIVSDQDGLDEISLGFSLRDTGSPTELGLRVLYGGRLARPEAASGSRMRVALRLPRPLREAERHEYSVMTTLPPTLAMQKHYAYTPATRCDRFHLRVRFDPDRAPERVWRVADAFHRDLDERVMDGEPLQLDGCVELETSFEYLRPGHVYGFQWAGSAVNGRRATEVGAAWWPYPGGSGRQAGRRRGCAPRSGRGRHRRRSPCG